MIFHRKINSYLDTLRQSPLGYRFATGAFWSIAGAITYQLLMVVSSVLVARMLGKVGFGQLGVVSSTVAMVSSFVSFGLGVTANKFVAECKNNDPERAGKVIGLSGLMAFTVSGSLGVGLIVLSPWLATEILGAPELINPIRLSSIIIFLTAAKGSQLGALAGLESFKIMALINIVVGFTSLAFVPMGAYYLGLVGAVYGLIVVIFVNYVLCYVSLRAQLKKCGIKVIYRGCFDELGILCSYSAPAIISSILQTPTIWVCNALLVNQRDGFSQMGVYNAAIKFQIVITFLGAYLGSVLFSMLSSQEEKQKTIIDRLNIVLPLLVSATVAIPLMCFPEILSIVFGPEYSGMNSMRVFSLVVVFSCFVVFRDSLNRVLSSSGRMWLVASTNLVSSVSLVCIFYFLKEGGAVSLSLSFIVSSFLSIIILCYLCLKLSKINFEYIINSGFLVLLFFFVLSIINTFYVKNTYLSISCFALGSFSVYLIVKELMIGLKTDSHCL